MEKKPFGILEMNINKVESFSPPWKFAIRNSHQRQFQ